VRFFALFFLFCQLLLAENSLKIATYNVENLFDLAHSGHEYKEYVPNSRSQWNLKNYNAKLKNISKVIKEIDADIIALQEIESLKALQDLRLSLKKEGLNYKYYKIANAKSTTIKVALLSKIPFVSTREIQVSYSYKYRNILEAKFRYKGQSFYVFVNHWKSKAGPESMRIVSAKALRKRVHEIGLKNNIILVGDFNSDYEENKKFLRKRKHNDTHGRTGINDVLNEFYNLWYDAPKEQRYTYIYRGKKEALDNILISPSLQNNKNFHYKAHSIRAYKAKYLFKGKNLYRWQTRGRNPRVHKGKGYSDHLGVIAEFLVKEDTTQ
jgi:predicted extracellular nuclease